MSVRVLNTDKCTSTLFSSFYYAYRWGFRCSKGMLTDGGSARLGSEAHAKAEWGEGGVFWKGCLHMGFQQGCVGQAST